jgi:hypothetical protein
MTFKAIVLSATAAVAVFATTPASAIQFSVNALANSSTGGVGVNTVSITAGQTFSVTVDPNDLWSAGALPRWSNADGLTGDRFATAGDDSGQAAGTKIGIDWGLWTEGNLTAPFGTLVGRIGGGDFFKIGTSFTQTATTSGVLELFYWDSNFADNSGSILADVVVAEPVGTPTPLPGALPLFVSGAGALGFIALRRRRTEKTRA